MYRLGYGGDDLGRSRCDGTERIAIASYVSLANPKPTRPRRCRSPNSWPSWVSRRAMRIALAAILARNLGVPSARLGPVPVTMSAHSPVSDATGSPTRRLRTVRCTWHARCPYQPFRWAANTRTFSPDRT